MTVDSRSCLTNIKTRVQLIYEQCGKKCGFILMLYPSVVNSWQFSVNVAIYLCAVTTDCNAAETRGAKTKMDPTRYQNVKRSLARRSRDKDVAAFQWTFGTGLGPVVNLTWTVENCYQASPNGTNAIQLIYMHPIMKRLMWVFLYFQSVSSLQNNLAFYLPTKKKKLPQSSVRC